MTPSRPPRDSLLSLSLLARIDRAADRFEDAWEAGQRPLLEEYDCRKLLARANDR
jgi:hypothetical protein